MRFLLDSNVLIAMFTSRHVHHAAAHAWHASVQAGGVATCPVTQGALVRAAVRDGIPANLAVSALAELASQPHHEFWPDHLSYLDADLSRVTGHRQVTDAYLAALARHHSGRLATFDRGLAALHPDVAELVPTG